MTSSEIRTAFLEFFRSKVHDIVPSSSLIPGNDPSLLFTNAGMVQFKSVFLGIEKRPYSRAASSQKCMRAGGKHSDLENVGHTARHHTFFEMLGNFSFGDYFKKGAILYAWELLTEHFQLPKDKLWVTVFEEDDEGVELWKDLVGIPESRIVRLGAKDNFWQMGDTGPCGPCSEILIDQGASVSCGHPDCAVGCDCDRYLELWNLVFMQYDRDATGKLNPLPRPSIDTGMGLERISAVLQGRQNNFDTDLFYPIISAISAYSQKDYDKDRETDIAIRVIADHIRAITFLLSEGLIPSNEGRGYVLRRIIRRASRYTKNLHIDNAVLFKLVDSVIEAMGSTYPELINEAARVKNILQLEEERFSRTLEHGLELLESVVSNVKSSRLTAIPGSELFKLYDTYGFPLDIARDVAAENGLEIDEPGFHHEMELQKTKARASWTGEEESAGVAAYRDIIAGHEEMEFTGYESLESDSTVTGILVGGQIAGEISTGMEGEVLLDRTPFYAESGGQVGDTGELKSDAVKAVVLDTVKPGENIYVHRVKVLEGSLKKGDRLLASVDPEKRHATMRNHTATHLLHAALRHFLGEHVKQAGSYVSPERFRFDFNHFNALGEETLESLEDDVNRNVLKNISVTTVLMDTKTAVDSGVVALFGEKYGDRVRAVIIPDVSKELCGGTHVRATGDIGLLKIISEGSLASGVRRIEAVTGTSAVAYFRNEEKELKKLSALLKTSDNPSEKLSRVLSDMKELEKALEKYKGRSAAERSLTIMEKARDVDGIKVVAHRVDGIEQKDLRTMADSVRDGLGSGILVLASVTDGQAAMVAMVTDDLTGKFNAGAILKQIASAAGGRGGGKPDLAQGGTREIKKLDKALESLYDIIKKQ